MASTPKLRASVPGEHSGPVRGDGSVPGVSEGSASTSGPFGRGKAALTDNLRDESLGGTLPLEHDVIWSAAQPASGQMIRARHADHHTAALVFTRDDREGNWYDEKHRIVSQVTWTDGEGWYAQNWWAHDWSRWVSWQEIGNWLSEQDQDYIVEILVRPSRGITHRTCEPDGACRNAGEGSASWD